MAQAAPVEKHLGTVSYQYDHGKYATAKAIGRKFKTNVKISDQFVEYEGNTYNNAQQWINFVFNSSGRKCTVKIDSTPRPAPDVSQKPTLSFGSLNSRR
jgi:hypothetical protein